MTIHHLPADINRKLDQLTATLDKLASKLDNLTNITQLTHDLPDSHELDECSTCSNLILPGNAYVYLPRMVEQHELVDGKEMVTVIDSDVLAIFCAECGNRHASARDWRKLLAEKLELDVPEERTYPEEICDLCHCTLPNNRARVSLDLTIAQIDVKKEGWHIPIYAEVILSFCPACGNKMSRERLAEVIDELLTDEGGKD